MFLRVTHGISRRQELVADRLAAQWVGSRPFVEALGASRGAFYGYRSFMDHEVFPVVEAGYRPPLAEGFDLFLSQPSVVESIRRIVEQETATLETGRYDTHPSLQERIEAVQSLPPVTASDPELQERAVSLVPNLSELEPALYASLFSSQRSANLRPIEWQSVAAQVWLPYWIRSTRHFAPGLKGVTADGLPGILQSAGELGAMFQQWNGTLMPDVEQRAGAMQIAATAFTVALVGQGWTLNTTPGGPASLRRGESCIEPFSIIPLLATGALDAETWRARCEEAGIVGLPLDSTDDAG